MPTAIASWGNSDAVRIPREALRSVGLRRGDRVSFIPNEKGHLEIVPEKKQHRRVEPARGITFETLFKGYQESAPEQNGWANEDMVGAEWDAWAR